MGRHAKPEPTIDTSLLGEDFDRQFNESLQRVEQQVQNGDYPYDFGAVRPPGEEQQ